MLGFDNISAYLLEELFNLKFAAKDLERNAKKSEKSEKEEKTKLKKVSCMTHFRHSPCYAGQQFSVDFCGIT